MERNKVVFGNEVLIDLTADTVTAEKLVAGYTAHDASGEQITGAYTPKLQPIAYDYESGYVNGGTWNYQNSVNNHSDVYEIELGHEYVLYLGSVRGTRFRAVEISTNPVGSTSNINGTNVVNQQNPAANAAAFFTADRNGYLVVTKDNVGTTGLMSYLADIT